jgi:hypothetical protein
MRPVVIRRSAKLSSRTRIRDRPDLAENPSGPTLYQRQNQLDCSINGSKMATSCLDCEALMFETLEEQIEKSESSHLSTQQKVFRFVGLLALTAVVFSALFMAVQMFG